MAKWNVSISGNDTARDLIPEYTAAFYAYDTAKALRAIDHYVRESLFDETDAEDWCNYIYSLADFMWKRGILTKKVKTTAIEMIDSGFGMEVWENASERVHTARERRLAEFRERLLSPQPPKKQKKIKPNVHMEKIFEVGDLVAVQLQTANKKYTAQNERPITEEEFRAMDGKYVLMQHVGCHASWYSKVVPEIKDYWAHFRLFDGVWDEPPTDIDPSTLKDAILHEGSKFSSVFYSECNMHYFRRRNYKIVGKYMTLPKKTYCRDCSILWQMERGRTNPDSIILSAMGKERSVGDFTGDIDDIRFICDSAIRYGRYNQTLSKEENEKLFKAECDKIVQNIEESLAAGGKAISISYGTTVGIATVLKNRIDNVYVRGDYQHNGFGTELMKYALEAAGNRAYIDVPAENKVLIGICEHLDMVPVKTRNENTVRMSINKKPGLFQIFKK